jgi:hypothetical protein
MKKPEFYIPDCFPEKQSIIGATAIAFSILALASIASSCGVDPSGRPYEKNNKSNKTHVNRSPDPEKEVEDAIQEIQTCFPRQFTLIAPGILQVNSVGHITRSDIKVFITSDPSYQGTKIRPFLDLDGDCKMDSIEPKGGFEILLSSGVNTIPRVRDILSQIRDPDSPLNEAIKRQENQGIIPKMQGENNQQK